MEKDASVDTFIDGHSGFVGSILSFAPGKKHFGEQWELFVYIVTGAILTFTLFTVFSAHVAVLLIISCAAGMVVFHKSSNPTTSLIVTLGSILFFGAFLLYYRSTHSLALDSTGKSRHTYICLKSLDDLTNSHFCAS